MNEKRKKNYENTLVFNCTKDKKITQEKFSYDFEDFTTCL